MEAELGIELPKSDDEAEESEEEEEEAAAPPQPDAAAAAAAAKLQPQMSKKVGARHGRVAASLPRRCALPAI